MKSYYLLNVLSQTEHYTHCVLAASIKHKIYSYNKT